MNERLDEFEAELSQLRPRGVSAGLTDRLAAQLDVPTPARPSWSDRCLMTFMTGGALAASVIVGLMGWSVLVDRTPTSASNSPSLVAVQKAPVSIAEYQVALARLDGTTLESLR